MYSLIRYLLFFSALCFGHTVAAQAQTLEDFEVLSQRLGAFPTSLVSIEGEAYHWPSEDFNDSEKSISLVDQDGTSLVLPDRVLSYAFPERPGEYALLLSDGRRLTTHIATLSGRLMKLGPAIPDFFPNAGLTALHDGQLMEANLRGEGQIYIRFLEVQTDALEPAIVRGAEFQLASSARKLGPVRHPVTGEPGYALSPTTSLNIVEVYFPKSDPITLTFPPSHIVFAADGNRILFGANRTACTVSNGLPEGLCTPDLYIAPLVAEDRVYSLEDRENFDWIARPFPDFTFGYNNVFLRPSDFRLLGNRLQVIAYRGPIQVVLEYDLTKREAPIIRVPAQDGVELNFGVSGGVVGRETTIIAGRSYIRPRFTLALPPDTETAETIVSIEPYKEITDLEIVSWTFENAPDLSPFTVVGRQTNGGQNFCSGGKALVEVYGGGSIPLEPFNVLGLVPSLFEKDGIYIAAHIRGGGGYGNRWAQEGANANAVTQAGEVLNLVKFLREFGCEELTLLGGSYGGVVALHAAFLAPEEIGHVIAVNTALDLREEYRIDNRAISSHLPRPWSGVSPFDFAKVSPKEIAAQADDLSGLNITLITGELDRRVTTDKNQETIALFREKGAEVNLIVREGIGHSKHNSLSDWARYYYEISHVLNQTAS